MTNLKQNIFKQIKDGDVKPKPKWFFLIRNTGIFLSYAFLLAFSFYLLAALGFILSEHDWIQSGTMSLSGLYFLFHTLPITLIIVAIAMITVAALVTFRYGQTYKRPFILSLSAMVLTLIITHSIFVQTGIRQLIKEKAWQEGIDLAPSFIKNLREEIKQERNNNLK